MISIDILNLFDRIKKVFNKNKQKRLLEEFEKEKEDGKIRRDLIRKARKCPECGSKLKSSVSIKYSNVIGFIDYECTECEFKTTM